MALSDFNNPKNKDKNKGKGPLAPGSDHKSDSSKYNQNKGNGQGQGPVVEKKRFAGNRQLDGTKYRDMGAEYQNNISKAEYKERRNSQRMAGDALQDSGINKARRDNYKVDNLQDFDLRATGAGGTLGGKYQEGEDGGNSTYGAGEARLSKSDVKGLMRKGDFDAKDIRKYGRGLDAESGEVFGVKAQKFLNKKIKQQKNGVTEEETTTEAGTNPETDGGDDNAGQTNPGNNADTPNPEAGAEAPGNQQYSDKTYEQKQQDTSVTEMTLAQGADYNQKESSADFVSRFMGINTANQPERVPHYKKYLGNEVDVTKLDERIGKRSLYHEAKSKLAGLNVYGDHDAYKPSDWNSPLGEDPIESYDPSEDTEDIYGEIKKAAG